MSALCSLPPETRSPNATFSWPLGGVLWFECLDLCQFQGTLQFFRGAGGRGVGSFRIFLGARREGLAAKSPLQCEEVMKQRGLHRSFIKEGPSGRTAPENPECPLMNGTPATWSVLCDPHPPLAESLAALDLKRRNENGETKALLNASHGICMRVRGCKQLF